MQKDRSYLSRKIWLVQLLATYILLIANCVKQCSITALNCFSTVDLTYSVSLSQKQILYTDTALSDCRMAFSVQKSLYACIMWKNLFSQWPSLLTRIYEIYGGYLAKLKEGVEVIWSGKCVDRHPEEWVNI
jgi:hypothetical protein